MPATPSAVKIEVLDHATATKMNVPGFLFRVSRTDAAAVAGEVRAVINYATFADAYSSDYPYRLQVVAYPACFLTTPAAPHCGVGTPLPVTNDIAAQTLTVDLSVAASSTPSSPTTSSTKAAAASPSSSATANAAGSMMVFAVTSNTSSTAVGNWAATSLKDSDTWSVGASAGDFNYSYPIALPPSPGGLAPSLDLLYDSQSVDGRTSATNGQASDVGMGWDRSQPFIERSYRSCGDQYTFSSGASGFADSGDACFDAGQALTLSMGSVASPLVQSGTSGTYALKNDNGYTVQQVFGASNNDQNGEYWVVTTTTGVKYYFGLGANAFGTSSSVQVEPVFDVPGYSKTAGVSKAYRWNLDKVVDPHGNTISYIYNRDGNTVYSSKVTGTLLGFTRDAYVSDIYYGANDNNANPNYATGWAHFDYGYRCFNNTPIVPGTCSAPNSGSSFPDVPTDLICVQGQSTTCNATSPTFYHTKVLTRITTRAADNTTGVIHSVGGWRDVDYYDLSYSFLSTGDTRTSAALWLRNIARTGVAADGATTSNQQVTWLYSTWTLDGSGSPVAASMPNRIDNNGNYGTRPPVNMYRLGEIVNPLGGVTRIGYFQPDAPSSAGAIDVRTNNSNLDNYDEFAQYLGAGGGVGGSPAGGAGYGTSGTPFGWFNKYLVQYVATQDLSPSNGDAPAGDAYTGYGYTTAASEGDVNTGAAWRYASNAINPTGPVVADRAWTEYRGYRNVNVTHAAANCNTATCNAGAVDSQDSYVYFRGMDGDCTDKTCTATHKSVSVTSSFVNDTKLPCSTDAKSTTLGSCDSVNDDWRLQGMLRAHQHKDASGNQVSGYVDWHAYGYQPGGRFVATDANQSASAMVVPLWDLAWHANGQYVYTSYTYDDLDQVLTTSTRDYTNTAYNCTQRSYTRTPTGQSVIAQPTLELPSSRTDYGRPSTGGSGDCGTGIQDAWSTAAYDGSTNPTSATSNTSSSAAIATHAGFDVYGRQTSATDGNGNTTSTSYGPLYINPLTVTVTDPLGHTTTTQTDPGRGLPEAVIDGNGSTPTTGNTTTAGYDALGRLTSVWRPADAVTHEVWRPSGGSPSTTYAYQTIGYNDATRTVTGRNVVTTTTKQDGGTSSVYTYLDGTGRTFETAALSPDGSDGVFNATLYDPEGRTVRQTQPFLVASSPGNGEAAVPTSPSPDGITETDTGYDAASRPVSASTVFQGNVINIGGVNMTTTTSYADDHTTVTPPAPAGASTTWIDQFGRTYQVDQAGPSGTVTTKYIVDDHNRVTDIYDANNNHTSYTYDALGRKLTSHDPDTGSTSAVYDNDGNVITATSAKGIIVNSTYDADNRKTADAKPNNGVNTVGGITGLWKLNETSGTTAADSSGNGNNGTLSATGVTWTTDRGGAAKFDGSTGEITTATPGIDTSKSFTVSAWVKMSSLSGEQTFVAQTGSSLPSMYLEYSAAFGGWSFVLKKQNNSGTAPTDYDVASAATPTSAVGNWTHLAGVYDATAGTMTLYVDGRPAGSATHTTPWQGTGPMTIGGAGTTSYTSASVSVVQTYQSALSVSNVGSLSASIGFSQYDTAPGGIGQLASSTSHELGYSYTVSAPGYNADGQPTGKTWTIPSGEGVLAGTYTETYGFDSVTGKQNSVTYPAAGGLPAETVTGAYDSRGLPTTLTSNGVGSGAVTYVAATPFNSLGQMTGRTLGAAVAGQVVRTYGYDPQTQALDYVGATAANGTTTVQNDFYSRNAAGEVTSLADGVSGQDQCYKYDSLSRMTDAYTANHTSACSANDTFGPAPYGYHYTFDNINNIQTITDNITPANNKTFAYTDTAHVHAPTSDGAGSSFAYDQNGDMTTRTTPANGTQTLGWVAQELTTITAGTNSTTFVDGPEAGGRLLRHDPGGSAVLYIDGEELALNGSTVTATRYYAGQDGATVAQRTPTTLTWLLSDVQGSASIAVNASTGAFTRQYYTPYGNQRGGNTLQPITDHAFLGHVQDYNTGLVQDGARYYDPATGRFISPDPINTSGPDQLNGYAYAGNAPVTRSDPSGQMTEMLDGGGGEAITNISGCYGPGGEWLCGEQDHGNNQGRIVPPIPGGIPDGFGPAPVCPESESCKLGDPPINAHGPVKPNDRDRADWAALVQYAGAANLAGFSLSSTLLLDYLSGKGTTVGLTPQTVDSLYNNVDVVRQKMNKVITDGVNSLSGGNTEFVGPWMLGDVPKVRPLHTTSLSTADWFLSFADFDYRVAAERTSSGITFRIQVRKYYDFDSDISFPGHHFTVADLSRLNDTGQAQNFWIFGQSDTLPLKN